MMLLIGFVAFCFLCLCSCYIIGLCFFKRAIFAHSKKSFILVDPHHKLTADDHWYLQESHYQDVELITDTLHLHGSVIQYPKSHQWIILLHGYMGRLEDMLPQAHAFYQRGYNIFLPDLRGHGKSEGDIIGFGYLDHKDVLQWIAFLQQYNVHELLLYGVSMGASTAMMCCDQSNGIDAVIEDCGFTDLTSQLNYVVSHMVKHIPSTFLVGCLSLVMKAKAGYRLRDADCTKHVVHAKVPMLFMHGKRDGFIESHMMETLYELCPSKKQKALIPKGRHANSNKLNPVAYWEAIDKFLCSLKRDVHQ